VGDYLRLRRPPMRIHPSGKEAFVGSWGARILEARSFGRVPLKHMAHPNGAVAA